MNDAACNMCLNLMNLAAMAGIILLGNATIFSREALQTETVECMVFYLALSMMILVLYAMILNSTLEIITRRKTEENRFIHLNARWMEDHLVMVVENSCNGHIRKSGDKILSGKKDGGLGMMSIRRILNRPGDDFDIDFNENRFTAMVCIADRTAL